MRSNRILKAAAIAIVVASFFGVSAGRLVGSEAASKPAVPVNGVLWGAAVAPFKRSSSDHEQLIEQLESQMGRRLAISVHYYFWGAPGDGGSPALTAGAVKDDASLQGDVRNGRIPLISWRCGDNMTKIASGADDAAVIVPAALALKSLKVPVFLRWFYEWNLLRNGKENDKHFSECFSQPNRGTAAQQGEFVAAWKHIHDVFDAQGATNVAWVWCIAGAPNNVTPDLPGFLPPRPYVDWTAEDGYDKRDAGFVATYAKAYDTIGTLDGLPNMIAESGENAQNAGAFTQARWLEDAAANIGPGKRFSNVRAFVYSDQPAGVPGKDWSLDAEGARAFALMGAAQVYRP